MECPQPPPRHAPVSCAVRKAIGGGWQNDSGRLLSVINAVGVRSWVHGESDSAHGGGTGG